MRRIVSFAREETGGLALEATLVLPLFLAFVMALQAFIQLSIAELALQTAVSETTKQLAAGMYPVQQLYSAAKEAYAGSKAGALLGKVLERIDTARSALDSAEQMAERYESWIPEPLLVLLRWEQERRERLETETSERYERYLDQTYRPLLNAAFAPLVWRHADERVLRGNNCRVTQVTLPDLAGSGETLLGIEASCEVKLTLPFVKRTILVKKAAYEQVWIGK
ncbi:TadE/TadG family type IV pilus assembly protein [Paenibacillus cymbidii]|uniref:TadE/TadG family type IV pilus assembly protein n=1 Tax=Paenibacillus cymbidii TaxID=1639034 RepID=UPI001082035E|nr:pilus assembly protein [Paenibacillus cymbidii]